jgi:hypothetical protein
MAVAVDTSVWISLFRDRSGQVRRAIDGIAAGEEFVIAAPVRLELLQGCRTEDGWKEMTQRLSRLPVALPSPAGWDDAARLYFELRQQGRTVRSSMDCVIASICLQESILLIHSDRDFETIATIRPLQQRRLDVAEGS